MAEIKASIENDAIKGDIEIWPSVAAGVLAAGIIAGVLGWVIRDDGDGNTYRPSELNVVTFSPEPGLSCRGLSPEGTSEIIASTIICVEV